MGNRLKTEIVPPKAHAIGHIVFGLIVLPVGIIWATSGHPILGCIVALAAASIGVNGWRRLRWLKVQK